MPVEYEDGGWDRGNRGGYGRGRPRGRGRGGFRGRGRGGYNGPHMDMQQDGGYNYEPHPQGNHYNHYPYRPPNQQNHYLFSNLLFVLTTVSITQVVAAGGEAVEEVAATDQTDQMDRSRRLHKTMFPS